MRIPSKNHARNGLFSRFGVAGAVVATVAIDTSDAELDNLTAWQRFLPTGPVALLPMGKQFSNVVWSTHPEHAEELLALNDEDFAAYEKMGPLGMVP